MAGKGIKKAGGLIWPTARVLSGRRSCRLRLARDGHRSPAIPDAIGRHVASEIQQHLHSETASKLELDEGGDLHTSGQSRLVVWAVSTSLDDDVGQTTDDVGAQPCDMADTADQVPTERRKRRTASLNAAGASRFEA